jgi:ferredoxin
MKNVKVNQENCIGCGMCEGVCPEVFQLNDDFVSTVIAEPTEFETHKDKIIEAKEGCPTSAIEVEE